MEEKNSGYIKMPNEYFDVVMSNCSASSWLVFCVIVRKTAGWRKEEDAICYDQIMKCGDIGSEHTVSKALKELVAKKFVIARVVSRRKPTLYSINPDIVSPAQNAVHKVQAQHNNSQQKKKAKSAFELSNRGASLVIPNSIAEWKIMGHNEAKRGLREQDLFEDAW